MLDTKELERTIQIQITNQVNDQISKILSSDAWLESVEHKIVRFTQTKILERFTNVAVAPEIIESVKHSVADLFAQGQLPGIEQYIKPEQIALAADLAVQQHVNSLVESLGQDPEWVDKIEKMINQTIVQRTVAKIASTDINTVIRDRVDENLETVHKKLMANFTSNGISDQATDIQLTVMNDATVIENQLVVKNCKVVENILVKDLTVTGSINTDNRSWHTLAEEIGRRTLEQIDTEWQNKLVEQVVKQIQTQGINFDHITVQDQPLVDGNTLSSAITDTNIQKLGHLRNLVVKGEAHIYETLSVVNRRLGVNTATPESAFSVWDEEVAVIIGKHKAKQAYIGTSRDQNLILGVNRQPQVEIDTTGLTRVKKLQIGLHKISHDTQVPGWSGTRGDMVFNANPGSDRVFAWVCLGAHKWQTLKSAE
jgi:hypothetical protein